MQKKNGAMPKKNNEILKSIDEMLKKSDAMPKKNEDFGLLETIETVKNRWTPPWTWDRQKWEETAVGFFLGLLFLLVYSVMASVAVGVAIILVAAYVVLFSLVGDGLDIITGLVEL